MKACYYFNYLRCLRKGYMSMLEIGVIVLSIVGILSVIIYLVKIVPYVVKHRGCKGWDFLPGSHDYKRLREYKRFATENNESLFWYKFEMSLIIIEIIIFAFCAFLLFNE